MNFIQASPPTAAVSILAILCTTPRSIAVGSNALDVHAYKAPVHQAKSLRLAAHRALVARFHARHRGLVVSRGVEAHDARRAPAEVGFPSQLRPQIERARAEPQSLTDTNRAESFCGSHDSQFYCRVPRAKKVERKSTVKIERRRTVDVNDEPSLMIFMGERHILVQAST